MKTNWLNSIPLLLASEGPEVNIGGSEPGGASKYGVSVAALSDLRRAQGLGPATVDIVSALTEQDAEAFYLATTARACRFDDLPLGVDYVMLDITANLGNTGGPWLLQIVMGLWPLSPIIQDDLVAHIVSLDDVAHRALIQSISAGWLAFKHASPGWSRAGHGWTNRMVRVRGDALTMTGEK